MSVFKFIAPREDEECRDWLRVEFVRAGKGGGLAGEIIIWLLYELENLHPTAIAEGQAGLDTIKGLLYTKAGGMGGPNILKDDDNVRRHLAAFEEELNIFLADEEAMKWSGFTKMNEGLEKDRMTLIELVGWKAEQMADQIASFWS